MTKLRIKIENEGCGGVPDFADAEDEVVTIQFGSDRVSPNFFELQRLMSENPEDDSSEFYVLNGDFLHAVQVKSFIVDISKALIVFKLPTEKVNSFDGIEEVEITHSLPKERIEDIVETLIFMSRGLSIDLNVRI